MERLKVYSVWIAAKLLILELLSELIEVLINLSPINRTNNGNM